MSSKSLLMTVKTTDPILKNTFLGLKDKKENVRSKNIGVLYDYVEKNTKELSGESFSFFIESVMENLQELINSKEINERITGILSLEKLIDLHYEDPRKITRFSNYLRNSLTNYHSDSTTVALVARALGKLAKASSTTSSKTLTAELVEFECKRALEWLEGFKEKHKDEGRRYAGLLVLKELAENAPTLFYAHVSSFLIHIWKGIKDSNLETREASILALRAVLALVSERNFNGRHEWYHDMLNNVKTCMKKNNESIHGALLVIGELLRNTGQFMKPYFEETCEKVFQFASSKDASIKKAVIRLIPQFAKFNSKKFEEKKYLERAFGILFSVVKTSAYNNIAFQSLGELALRVGSISSSTLKRILTVIEEDGITPSRNRPFEPAALECLAKVATVSGPKEEDNIKPLLDKMFIGGLSTTLTKALDEIVISIPGLLQPVQEKLLDLISYILAKAPFTSLSKSLSNFEINHDSTVLALITLWSFNFKGHNLSDFAADCVVKYLDSPSGPIRKEAIRSCCKLLIPKNGKRLFVNEVLEKLITVCITDSDPSIRLTVLNSLDERFDQYLALSDNLRLLFIAMNDEIFEIREVAMSIIGRLSTRNPAFVLPALRKTLIQLLTELEFSEDTRNKEESARMLGKLIAAAPRLIKPYVPSILKVLVTKISDPNPTVSACVMDTTGKLAIVGGTPMMKFMEQLVPLILEMLQDQSSPIKREVAVRTLGMLVQSTGYVITPYIKYPKLLSLLLSTLKSEEDWSTRQEVMKVLGIIGAIDPYKYKNILSNFEKEKSSSSSSSDQIDIPTGPSNEDFFPTVAINSLMKILKDSSLSTLHGQVIQSVTFIFTSLGLKCVPFLPQIVPPFVSLIRTCEPSMRNTLFQQLSQLVQTVRGHIKNYIDEIFVLIQEFWPKNYKIQIIILEEEICRALNEEFKKYLSDVIPQILAVLTKNTIESEPNISKKVLESLIIFGRHLEDYLYLVIPSIIRVIETTNSNDIRIDALRTLGKLCNILNLSEYSGRIIHPLVRILKNSDPSIKKTIFDTLCIFVKKMRYDYAIFIPMVSSAVKVQHQDYELLISKLLNNALPEIDDIKGIGEENDDEYDTDKIDIQEEPVEVRRVAINQLNLKKSWEASQRSTKEDWIEWIRGFSVELLRESPSPALRACKQVGQIYHPLARELFNAGFVSCWFELDDKAQSELVRSLFFALSNPNLPPEVLSTLLNLAEFMEHDDKPLPIPISTLGSLAGQAQAYAKALHHFEIEFQDDPQLKIEDLITINNQLGQHEAAVGLLVYAQKYHNIELKESWYEKLQRWEDAYDVYDKKQQLDPYSIQLTQGRMRCLKALGEWQKLYDLCLETWNRCIDDNSTKIGIAPMGASAAWNLLEWKFMKECVKILPDENFETSYFNVLISINEDDFDKAHSFIDKTRKTLDSELSALVSESYTRAYDTIVKAQQLSELEEVIEYKTNPSKRNLIKQTWKDRLSGLQRNLEHWQTVLAIRSLVLNPEEQIDDWLKFATLCRKSNKLQLSEKTLISLGACREGTNPTVEYEFIRHVHDSGKIKESLELLCDFSETVQTKDNSLLARVFLALGNWQYELDDNVLNEENIPIILNNFKTSTIYDKEWSKAWHSFAFMNSEIVQYYEKSQKDIVPYLCSAVNGYFKSISLSSETRNSQQDILRLLTLWFQYGDSKKVEKALIDGFNTVNIDTWLQVIPQLIARIHSPSETIRRLIHDLLTKIGHVHPQALIYPLVVSTKSQSKMRKEAAETMVGQLRTHSPTLVDQALIVSQELIRVAILWIELWHEALEEASRLYFGEHDIKGMIKILEPLHEMIEKTSTLSEIAFQQAFGRDLQEAWEWCKKYQKDKKETNLTQAWDLYYHVFRRISKQLAQMLTLELQYVSPKLLDSKDLSLALPGTYRPGSDQIIKIHGFSPQLKVLTSKQRPRKLKIYGSDGIEYSFLLKGHEDLRQDERVMQLFGLVNTLLKNDEDTSKRDLEITRYAVIPLSSNAGLIGWVNNTDTLHVLIKEYRESRNILLNIEHRLMVQMAPEYDNLNLIQKIEVFEHALENTTGQDLYKVLWLKSRNSEIWLERRTNYTRSLAVMSMVGHILGLGDRHPSNLMLEKYTGKVVHIDFGDCFEVAMLRDKYPERIPFRLTRMLVNAMEVSGIEGSYRSTCESVMNVLRQHKESVMAMLEAFVHDPLINWRLFVDEKVEIGSRKSSGVSISGDASDNESEKDKKPSRSVKEKEYRKLNDEDTIAPTVLNQKAVSVIERIQHKLNGRDFDINTSLNVPEQVNRLIESATSHSNLCQCYIGWCAFW
eukprot:gene2252-2426_t